MELLGNHLQRAEQREQRRLCGKNAAEHAFAAFGLHDLRVRLRQREQTRWGEGRQDFSQGTKLCSVAISDASAVAFAHPSLALRTHPRHSRKAPSAPLFSKSSFSSYASSNASSEQSA